MYNIKIKTTTQNILLVGFGENAFDIKEEMNQHFAEASFQNIDRLVDQSNWISNIENMTSTQAVIADYESMRKDEFMFLRRLQYNEKMRMIPFILVNKNNMPVNVKELLQMGVDDCYPSPIDWNGMTTRIHFLEKYKPFILAKADQLGDNPLQ